MIKLKSWVPTFLVILLTNIQGYCNAALISTLPAWDGTYHITALGAQTSTYGQTFRVSSDSSLDAWTFYARDSSSSRTANILFDVILTQWSGDRAVGPILFEARGLSVPDNDRGQFYEITLPVPNVTLRAQQQYVMLLNTSNYATDSLQKLDLAATPESYSEGEFWYQLSYNTFDNIYNFPWTCGDEGGGCRYGDSVFVASAKPISEPPAVALVLLALFFALRANHLLSRAHRPLR